MATAKGGYYTEDGTRVPSVTTILGRFKESGALIHWAAGQAAEYVKRAVSEAPTKPEVLKLCEAAKSAYRDVRDDAANAGTLAHEAVEAWIKGEPVSITNEKAKKSFEAFLEWSNQSQLKVIEQELPLVSEKYRFGGTFDAITLHGKLSMSDWKTSNGLYPEYLCQVAAYGILWEERFPDRPIEGGYNLMRFDKTFGDFSHHWWGELDTARKAFLLMRELYDCDKELKARSK